MRMFKANRPLEILSIHSQLVCSNDAIQKINWFIGVQPSKKYLQFEELVKVANEFYPKKNILTDLQYFDEAMN